LLAKSTLTGFESGVWVTLALWEREG